MKYFSLITFAIFQLFSATCGYYYQSIYVNNYECGNKSVALNTQQKEGGRLVIQPGSSRLCTFNVDADASSYGGSNISIYFNVRELGLMSQTELRIYEDLVINGTSTRTLVKDLPRSTACSIMPDSCGQLRTNFAQKPQLYFELFINKTDPYPQLRTTILDWTIVKEKTTALDEGWCTALKGYVSNKLLCDNEDDDRVSCPFIYTNTTGSNPVISTNHLSDNTCRILYGTTTSTTPYSWWNPTSTTYSWSRRTTTYSWWYPGTTTSWWYPSYNNNNSYYSPGLSTASVIGIVFGCLSCFIIVLIACLRMCLVSSRQQRVVQQQHMFLQNRNTPGYASNAGPVIVVGANTGAYATYPTAPPTTTSPPGGQFVGAPPDYSSMFPNNGNGAPNQMPMPGPPKY